MKVAVSASDGSLDAKVDPRFGRCPYYIIVDTETMDLEVLPNINMNAPSGAGIGAAQSVAQKGVEAVITGNLGPNASQVLSEAGIKMVTGAYGSVRQVIEDFKSGKLKAASVARYGGGFGGRGGGRGMGMGRGMVMGRGMGVRDTGMRRGMYSYPPLPHVPVQPTTQMTREQEKEMLTLQLEQLDSQLKEVKKRLEELK